MDNTFFRQALSQAVRRLGSPVRLISLVVRLGLAMRHLDGRQLRTNVLREHLWLLGRLVSAYAQGNYRSVPTNVILSVTAALIYFLNPFDVIPDALVGIGLADDFAVVSFVINSVANEIRLFKAWEASQGSPAT